MLGYGRGGDKRGGVLVDIKVVAAQKVWDPAPLDLIQLVGMNRIPVVVVEDIGINRIEHLRSERLAGLNFGVGTRFKVGERSLSIKAASEFIQIGAQQIGAFTRRGRLGQHFLHQDRLISHRRNFGDEGTVVPIDLRLGVARQVAMDRVTVFVSKRRDVVQRALKVHGEIGFGGIGTPAVGAAAFATAGHGIDPALVESFPVDVDVLLAKRRECLGYDLLRLVKAHVFDRRGNNGRVHVPDF